MKKGQADNKILIAVVIITVLVIGVIFFNQSNKFLTKNTNTVSTEAINEKAILEDTVLEKPIEEGIQLELTNPPEGANFNNPNITVVGNTEASAEVIINEKELRADLNGNFTTSLFLEEGENIIVVTVSDDEGNYAEKSLTVNYEALE